MLVWTWLLFVATALGAPLVHTAGPAYRFGVSTDNHLGWDIFQGQDTTRLLFLAYAGAMQADGSLNLGDLYGERKSDFTLDRTWDCPLLPNGNPNPDGLPNWDPETPCEYPSAALGQRYVDDLHLWDPNDEKVALWGSGNHTGHPPVTTIDSLDTSDEWERRWLRVDDPTRPCVVEFGREYTRCDIIVAYGGQSYIWTILMVPDQTAHQDRAIGGRCDLVNYTDLDAYRKGCSAYGFPTGVITPYQLVWLEAQVALAGKEGRGVIVTSHQPVPDTVALSSEGTSYLPQCSTGILVQSTPETTKHFPFADLPARVDLTTPIPGDPANRTPIRAAAENAGGLVAWYPGKSPRTGWGLALVRKYPGVVRAWISGHNHVPVPDFVDTTGRGMVYHDAQSDTTFLALGAVTRYWMTTATTGHPQAATLDLGADGTITWGRWSIQTHASGLAAHGCGQAAQLPPVRPAKWVNLNDVTIPRYVPSP